MRQVIERKTCTKCGQRKRLCEFSFNSMAKDKLQRWCKSCATVRITAIQVRNRETMFEHYGKTCACCGATTNLTIDHVHGNGRAHREKLGIQGGVAFQTWLASNGFPSDTEPGGEFELQVLCLSCNSSKQDGDHCRIHHFHPIRSTIGEVAADKATRDVRIFELQELGWIQTKIAVEVGCSQATVCRVLRAARARHDQVAYADSAA